MHPSRIEYPKIGDKVVYFDDKNHFTMCYRNEIQSKPVLIKYNEYTILSIVPGTGITFATFEEIHGLHDLSDFLRSNDTLLRKHKLQQLNDNVKRRSRRIFKVSF